jgi:hypothetical protein
LKKKKNLKYHKKVQDNIRGVVAVPEFSLEMGKPKANIAMVSN